MSKNKINVERAISNLRDEHSRYEDHENFKDWLTRKIDHIEVRLKIIEMEIQNEKDSNTKEPKKYI